MCKLEYHQGSFSARLGVCLLSFVCFLWVTPSVAESILPTTANLQASKNYIVSTNDDLVSVKATEASLKDIIERICDALGIEVEAQVGAQEKVTVEFHDLPLDQTIKHLSGNYAYTTDSDGSRPEKLFVFPKGETAALIHSMAEVSDNEAGRRASSTEPFKFEFDPAEFIQQGQ